MEEKQKGVSKWYYGDREALHDDWNVLMGDWWELETIWWR